MSYICKECNKICETVPEYAGHVGTHKESFQRGQKNSLALRLRIYEENPTLCMHCQKPLPYKRRKEKFCGQSCGAIYNNKKRKKDEKSLIEKNEVSTSFCLNCGKELLHKNKVYCNLNCQADYRFNSRLKIWLQTGEGMYERSPRLREYILQEQGGICKICGIAPFWNKKPMIFILDHLDGNSDNNKKENLRLICSNCDCQLDTYKGRNKNSGRAYRRQRYAEGKSY